MPNLNFDILNSDNSFDSKADTTLCNIYHKGQRKIWDGREVLDDLIAKHGRKSLDPNQKASLIHILTLILWGELAAWKTSAALASDIDNMGPKLAATSQAHDEARHFYVMRDYLQKVLDHKPRRNEFLSPQAEAGLNEVINAPVMSKKLLGMQLMVEPVAITIFHQLRNQNVEPILSELLQLYEQDEARHIVLGVRYLPTVLNQLSASELVGLLIWQCRMLKYEIDGLKDLALHFENLGIDPDRVLRAAEKRQRDAAQEMVNALGWKLPIVEVMNRFLRVYIDITWFGKSYIKTARELTGV